MKKSARDTRLLDERAIVTPIGIEFNPSLNHGEWEDLGRTIDPSNNWHRGDWMVYGEQHFNEDFGDERSVRAEARRTAYVARRVAPRQRHEGLSWEHHKEVAAFESPRQQYWLDKAEQNGWTHKELKRRVGSY